MQIGTLTLAGLRELAEEAGEKQGTSPKAEEDTHRASKELEAASAFDDLADGKRPDTRPQEEEKPVPRSLPNLPRPASPPTGLAAAAPTQPVKVDMRSLPPANLQGTFQLDTAP